jgi:hypothetical protein
MPWANRISAEIQVLARKVDRLEIDQARGVDILDDLEAAIYALRSLWAEAIASGCKTTARERLERFRDQLRPLNRGGRDV